jgi:hypothetical protein
MARFSQQAAARIFWLFLATGIPALCQGAVSEDQAGTPPKWTGSISIGASSWGSLRDLNSENGEGFDAIGWSLDFGGHRYMTRWGSADVLLGADFGFFGAEGDIPGLIDDYTQRGLYLTPSTRFRFGERGRRHLDLELGIGWYEVDIVELFCSSGAICSELDEPFNADRVGGYAGVSGGFGQWFVMGLRVHMADFGEVSGVGAVPVKLDGPIVTLNFGLSWDR